jgi:hypothetical protein
LGYEGGNTLINDINESCNLNGRLMIEFSSPKEPKGENSWFKANHSGNKDHKNNVIYFGSCSNNYIISSMLVFPCACGVVYHEIRPLEVEITMCEYTSMVEDSLGQAISSHYLSHFNDFQFEYDAKGKITCFWINHGHGELPQLLILCDLCAEF